MTGEWGKWDLDRYSIGYELFAGAWLSTWRRPISIPTGPKSSFREALPNTDSFKEKPTGRCLCAKKTPVGRPKPTGEGGRDFRNGVGELLVGREVVCFCAVLRGLFSNNAPIPTPHPAQIFRPHFAYSPAMSSRFMFFGGCQCRFPIYARTARTYAYMRAYMGAYIHIGQHICIYACVYAHPISPLGSGGGLDVILQK